MGKTVIAPRYDLAGDFSEGLTPVQIEEKWGYIDSAGREVIAPQFRQAEAFREGRALVGFATTDSSGETTMRYGFIDRRGKIVIKPDYIEVIWFSEGLAPVRVEE